MEQVQCPNCGGKDVYSAPVRQPIVGSESPLPPIPTAILTTATIGSLIVLGIGIYTQLGAFFIPGVLVFSICLVIMAIFSVIKDGEINSMPIKSYNNRCNICLNNWEWEVGAPKPRARINRTLIRMGNKRRRDEESQRRRSQGLL